MGLSGRRVRLLRAAVLSLLTAATALAVGSGTETIPGVADNLKGGSLPAMDKLEIRAELAASVTNPYDVEEIEVTGVFTDPDGGVYRIPGFYYQPFARTVDGGGEAYASAGLADWRSFSRTRGPRNSSGVSSGTSRPVGVIA